MFSWDFLGKFFFFSVLKKTKRCENKHLYHIELLPRLWEEAHSTSHWYAKRERKNETWWIFHLVLSAIIDAIQDSFSKIQRWNVTDMETYGALETNICKLVCAFLIKFNNCINWVNKIKFGNHLTTWIREKISIIWILMSSSRVKFLKLYHSLIISCRCLLNRSELQSANTRRLHNFTHLK